MLTIDLCAWTRVVSTLCSLDCMATVVHVQCVMLVPHAVSVHVGVFDALSFYIMGVHEAHSVL